MFESILIDGQPYFITCNHKTSKLGIRGEISEKFRILSPAEPSDYSYPPYEFASEKELLLDYSAAKKENSAQQSMGIDPGFGSSPFWNCSHSIQ